VLIIFFLNPGKVKKSVPVPVSRIWDKHPGSATPVLWTPQGFGSGSNECGSETLPKTYWYVSGCGSGFSDPYLYFKDPDADSRCQKPSVADPGCLYRIPEQQKMIYNNKKILSWFFIMDPDPHYLSIPDPRSRRQKVLFSKFLAVYRPLVH
jgi:hypothetical protein